MRNECCEIPTSKIRQKSSAEDSPPTSLITIASNMEMFLSCFVNVNRNQVVLLDLGEVDFSFECLNSFGSTY